MALNVPAPGLYGAKDWLTRRLRAVVDLAVARRLSPDVFTVAGVLAALVAGVAVAEAWWPLAAPALVGRLAGANLDGAVARARGVTRPFGFVLNEVGDRASDLLIMGGLVGLAWRVAPPGVALLMALSMVAATLPTFVALAAAGAGAPRINGGPFGKTERCLAALAGCVLAGVVPRPGPALGALAVAVIAGSLFTAGARLASARRMLSS